MKIHPLVGAEILERVRFPYPVVPIVRAHHEKWDGAGYPLASRGRRYRSGRAFSRQSISWMPWRLIDSIDELYPGRSDETAGAESGKSFDPKVVNVLQKRYRQLESWCNLTTARSRVKAFYRRKDRTWRAPAAGFEDITVKDAAGQEATFLSSIAAARQEAQTLFELSQDLGASLSLGETLSVFSVKLRRLVPYDAIAIYVKRGEELIPELGERGQLSPFFIATNSARHGLSGWVAQNRKPIINGNPSVEPGYLNDPTKFSTLRSALAIPLEGLAGVVGVLALYHAETDAFTSDHLRILLAISSKMALAIENALKYQQAESSAITDYLTGLPNARSLFLQLDRELARCKRDNDPGR